MWLAPQREIAYKVTMKTSDSNRELVDHVNQLINRGDTEISLPDHLVSQASDDTLAEVHRLCKITGVTVKEIDCTDED